MQIKISDQFKLKNCIHCSVTVVFVDGGGDRLEAIHSNGMFGCGGGRGTVAQVGSDTFVSENSLAPMGLGEVSRRLLSHYEVGVK